MNHIEFSQKEVLHNTQKISNGLFLIWFSAWLGSFDRTPRTFCCDYFGGLRASSIRSQQNLENRRGGGGVVVVVVVAAVVWSCGHVIVDVLPF